MLHDEAIKFARKATGSRWPWGSITELMKLTPEQASRAQFTSRLAHGGGVHFLAIDATTGHTLAPGFIVPGASAQERKQYTAELLTEAWGVLAAELQPVAANV